MAEVKTYSDLQLRKWLRVERLGNTGATGSRADGQQVIQPLPRLSKVNILPDMAQTKPQYATLYWWLEHGPHNSHTKARFEFDLWIPAAFALAPQAIEFEIQWQINGAVFNGAWQAPYREQGFWRHFTFAKAGMGAWVNSTVPFTGFAPDTWHRIAAEFERTPQLTMRHLSLEVDGVVHLVNVERVAYMREPDKFIKDKFNSAFQLDLDGKTTPTAYEVFVDNMHLTLQ